MYINVASPILFEEGAIKFIDLDVDYTTNDVHNLP
jgi:protein associated with RNAse G/E